MVSRTCNSATVCASRHVLRVCALAFTWALGAPTDGHAESKDNAWHAELRLYLTGLTNFWEKNGTSLAYNTIATTAELRLKADARPYYTSLFVDYQFSTDNVNLGGLFHYGWRNWDATTYLLINDTPRTSAQWLYAGRLRYRVGENHKLGIEAVGSFRDSGSPILMFGYYGSISESLSLNVVAGPVFDNGPDLAGRMELVWRVR